VPIFRSRIFRWLAAAVLLVGLLFVTSALWLAGLGRFLVESQAPVRADLAVVLAGDAYGNRILKAAELVKQGYVPKVLVSGPECCYGSQESDLAIAFAVKHGYPRDWFIPLPHSAHSTDEESRVIRAELARRKVQRFLLVTSDFHTRRATRVYRRLVPAESFRSIAAPDRDFTPEGWWHTREGRKQFFIEGLKTVADWIGL
jgi:uncharacterized SAM-binding protein YcdF (DUF218 family)